jgi:hypothetical protein
VKRLESQNGVLSADPEIVEDAPSSGIEENWFG